MIRWSRAAHTTVSLHQPFVRCSGPALPFHSASVATALGLLPQKKQKPFGDNLRKLFSENFVESYYVSRMCFHIFWACLIPGNSIIQMIRFGNPTNNIQTELTQRLLTGFPSFKQLGKAGLKLLDIISGVVCVVWYAAKSNMNVKMHHWPKKPLKKPYWWHIFSSSHGISLILRSWNASGASCGWAVQTVAGGTVLRRNGKVATALE